MYAKITKFTLTLLIIISFAYLASLLLNIYVADVYYSKAQALLTDNKLIEALDYANKSVKKNPNEPNYYKGRARIYIALSGLVKDQKSLMKNLALKDIQFGYNLNASNLVVRRNLVPLYYFLAADNLYLPGSASNVDPEYLPYAQAFFNDMKIDYPNDVGVYVLVAKYQKRLGLIDDFNDTKKRVETLRPDLLEWSESFR